MGHFPSVFPPLLLYLPSLGFYFPFFSNQFYLEKQSGKGKKEEQRNYFQKKKKGKGDYSVFWVKFLLFLGTMSGSL